MDKGYGGLMRQILSDPTYIIDIIKRRTADIIDMAKHVKIRVKPWSQVFFTLDHIDDDDNNDEYE